MANERILVVDQHRHTAQLLTSTLEEEGFAVCKATDSASAILIAQSFNPHIVISNATTSGPDGLELVRALQKDSQIAMILLTVRDALYSRDELVGRVRALLRRKQTAVATAGAQAQGSDQHAQRDLAAGHEAQPLGVRGSARTRLTYGDLELDYGRHDVGVAGVSARLSRTEFAIVAHLVLHPGHVVQYDDLLEAIWGRPYRGERHLLQVHIQRLRLKLAAAGADRNCIRNRWGLGYVIDQPDHVERRASVDAERDTMEPIAS